MSEENAAKAQSSEMMKKLLCQREEDSCRHRVQGDEV